MMVSARCVDCDATSGQTIWSFAFGRFGSLSVAADPGSFEIGRTYRFEVVNHGRLAEPTLDHETADKRVIN